MTLDLAERAAEMATERVTELTTEIDRLTPAAAYMRQLLDLIYGILCCKRNGLCFLPVLNWQIPLRTFDDRVTTHRLELAQRTLSEAKATISRAESQLSIIRPYGEFYLTMQRRILTSPPVMEAWQTFLISVQLVASKPIPGITQ